MVFIMHSHPMLGHASSLRVLLFFLTLAFSLLKSVVLTCIFPSCVRSRSTLFHRTSHISAPTSYNVYYSCQIPSPCTTFGVREQSNGRCIERMLSKVVDSKTGQLP